MAYIYEGIKQTTEGERLFHLLGRIHIASAAQERFVDSKLVRLTGRTESIAAYLEGSIQAFCFRRLMKLADHSFRGRTKDTAKAIRELRTSLKNWLHWLRGEDIDRLVRQAEMAWLSSNREIPKAESELVYESRKVHRCCMCGALLTLSGRKYYDPNGHQAGLEHLWPQSMGGDSIADNLLPACAKCNGAKDQMLTWQDGYLHGKIHDISLDLVDKKKYGNYPLVRKVLLHRRAVFTFAQLNRLTLKQAYNRVGHFQELKPIDASDTWDFFNLENHTGPTGELLWSAE